MRHLTRHPDRLQACFATMPDPRRGRNRRYAMQDIGLAALSVFFMQSPSFLAHQRTLAAHHGRSNAQTLFGLTRIPCDNHIRQLRDGDDALRANWFEIEIARPNGAVTYRNAFVADLPVNRDNVAELAACGRARWKIENETFNVLKHHGYRLEHNYGHGKDTLASVLLALNLLAFALHGACDLIESLWQQARRRLGSRIQMFEHLRTIACYRVFPSWTELMTLLATGRATPKPP